MLDFAEIIDPFSYSKLTLQHSEKCISPVDKSIHDNINDLFCLLMRTGWNELFVDRFMLNNSNTVNMDLVNWILRGEMNEQSTVQQFHAWLEIQAEFELNVLVNFLRKSNGNINFADESGETIFHVFLRECMKYLSDETTIDVVKELIEAGASVNAPDARGETPVHIVAEQANKSLMEVLLPKFTNVNAATYNQEDTVLHEVVYACNRFYYAKENQFKDIICDLLAKNANPNAENAAGRTPTQLAVENNFFKFLQIFLANGADVHQLTIDGNTLLHLACMDKPNPCIQLNIIELLIEKGCDVNAKTNAGFTPLHLAAELQCKRIVEKLIQLGANVNSKTYYTYLTPLHCAAMSNQPLNVAILLKNGADVNAENIDGITPLHIAALRKTDTAMKYLIKYGADVHRREKTCGFTALHIAVSGNKKKVQLLLKKGIDINVSNGVGITPLHLASLTGNKVVVQYLIENGAYVNCRGSYLLMTPLHFTSMHDNNMYIKHLVLNYINYMDSRFCKIFQWILYPLMLKEPSAVAKLLIKNGTDVNVKDSMGQTPLHIATLQPGSDMIEPLLDFGAYVDGNDYGGRTPLSNVLESLDDAGMDCLLRFGLNVNDQDAMNVIKKCDNIIIFDSLLNHAMQSKSIGLPMRLVFQGFTTIEKDAINYNAIEGLKLYKIPKTNFTINDFFNMKPKRRSTLAKQVLTMNLQYNRYWDLIQNSCHQAINRVKLLEPATLAFYQVVNTTLPDLCVEHIFSYLNNVSLRNLIAASAEI